MNRRYAEHAEVSGEREQQDVVSQTIRRKGKGSPKNRERYP
jgi:hypothetical protein